MSEPNLNALRHRREEIAREIAELKAEEAELAVAERVLRRLGGVRGELRAAPASSKLPVRSVMTQRELVVEVLGSHEREWLKSGEIIDAVQRSFGIAIPERSLAPLLSVMKRDGVLSRDGRLVALSERVGARSGRRSKT